MPSLQALEQFKDSFNNLGGEIRTLRELDLPFDNLPLPEQEPDVSSEPPPSEAPTEADIKNEFEAPQEYYDPDAGGLDMGSIDFGDLGDLLGGGIDNQSSETQIDDFLNTVSPDDGEADADSREESFNDFMDTIPDDPDDFNVDSDTSVSDETSSFGETSDFEDTADFDDKADFPQDLLNGFTDEIDAERAGSEEQSDEEPVPFNEDFTDLGQPDFSQPDFDLSSEPGFPEDDGFDMGGEDQFFDSEENADAVRDDAADSARGDSFDSFDLGSGAEDIDFGRADYVSDYVSDYVRDDFDFEGTGASETTGRTRDISRDTIRDKSDDSDEVEEIRLTEEELRQFQETLVSYPLNLRIACQELIAEQAVPPDQMSGLIKLLVNGATAQETAALAGKILGKTISIPKGFEKKTGEELETEQSSFAYIFVHKFLPAFRLLMGIALVLFSIGYLYWQFIYTPLRAERIYKLGIERIEAGEYSRARDRFLEAYNIHQKKSWFYTYARAFRDKRQYTLAEEKYEELLYFTASRNKQGIPEKAAVLEYAEMETKYIGNYEAADRILRRNILDFYPYDRDALLAVGDNSLAWGEYDASRLEDAREAYAMLIERYGQSDPLLERMLMYFIRTDNLEYVLPLQSYFMDYPNRDLSAETLAEMGGYLLDKRFEEVRGVPNQYRDSIGGIRDILLRAIRQDRVLPESYFHLARYYYHYDDLYDETLTLEMAIRVFENVPEQGPKRITYHIDALRRYAEILINRQEFLSAEETLLKGVRLYENGLNRRLLRSSPEFGRLYAFLGDLEYFVKEGDMESALRNYSLAEYNGWAPPEIQYRMGAAHYQLRQWEEAQDRFLAAFRETQPNRRILYALGNISYMRGNYFAAQGYYDRLLEILEDDRSRLPPIMPTDNAIELELAERLMVAQNNMGVVLEALAERTGNTSYSARALAYYADSERAWDILTRNPTTMVRMRPSPEINAPGINPAYLNVQNSLYPVPGFENYFFIRVDKDIIEPSQWESLAPPGYRLSQGIHTGR